MPPETLLSLTFAAGIVTECLFLLNKRPHIYSIIIFIGMFLYMLVITTSSMLDTSSQTGTQYLQMIPAQIFSLAGVFGFLFLAIFLKEVVKIVNEVTLFSLTITFWFLVLNNWAGIFSSISIIIMIGTIGTSIIIFLAYNKHQNSALIKTFSYGWFLFVNAYLAYLFFIQTEGIYMITSFQPETSSYINTFSAGLIATYLIMNAGLLYYSTIYLFTHPDSHKTIRKQMETLFTNHQISKQEIISILLFQIALFSIIGWLKPYLSLTIITFWTLLLPIIFKSYKFIRTKLIQSKYSSN